MLMEPNLHTNNQNIETIDTPFGSLEMYKVFTYKNKQASFLYRPLPIFLPHLDPEDKDFMTTCKDSLASQSFSPGMVKVKFSDVRNDGIDFLVVDTVVPMLNKIR